MQESIFGLLFLILDSWGSSRTRNLYYFIMQLERQFISFLTRRSPVAVLSDCFASSSPVAVSHSLQQLDAILPHRSFNIALLYKAKGQDSLRDMCSNDILNFRSERNLHSSTMKNRRPASRKSAESKPSLGIEKSPRTRHRAGAAYREQDSEAQRAAVLQQRTARQQIRKPQIAQHKQRFFHLLELFLLF